MQSQNVGYGRSVTNVSITRLYLVITICSEQLMNSSPTTIAGGLIEVLARKPRVRMLGRYRNSRASISYQNRSSAGCIMCTNGQLDNADGVFAPYNYLWRAVDQDGEVIDVFLQRRRDGKAAKRFFRRLLKTHRSEPRKIVTDRLRSYGVAHRELIPDTIHDTSQYANNRAELSHQPTRFRERGMRRFKSPQQAQRFLTVHAAVYNLFNLGRHHVSAKNYRFFRSRAFSSWNCATA